MMKDSPESLIDSQYVTGRSILWGLSDEFQWSRSHHEFVKSNGAELSEISPQLFTLDRPCRSCNILIMSNSASALKSASWLGHKGFLKFS